MPEQQNKRQRSTTNIFKWVYSIKQQDAHTVAEILESNTGTTELFSHELNFDKVTEHSK